jgi:inosine/xanthosine triphosphatase
MMLPLFYFSKKELNFMKIIIGSKNPAKIKAVKDAFQKYDAEYATIDIPSGVNDQPFSDEETIKGAINRAYGALDAGDGEIGIGLEGGVQDTEYGLFLCNWGALAVKGKPPIIAGGARIPLPETVAAQLAAGKELGPVMDAFTNKNDIRKKEGAIGVFTDGEISRSDMFSHVMKLLIGQYEYRKKSAK